MTGSNISLLKVLERPISNQFPIARKKTIASSTTDRPAKTFKSKYPEESRIVGVVYFRQLINQSVDLAGLIADKYEFDEMNPDDASFKSFISPTHSPSFCSPELFSENDTREYVNAVLIRPALAAMHIVATDGVPSKFNSTEANTDCYVTSGFRKDSTGPIADNVLIQGPFRRPESSFYTHPDKEYYYYRGDGNSPEGEINDEVEEKIALLNGPNEGGPFVLLTIEVKSSNAFTPNTFQDLTALASENGFDDSIVIPFVLPNADSIRVNKTTKFFAQISEQMIFYGVEYGWLTSFNENVFFYMKKGTRILYMSDQYGIDTMTPLNVFAWFCRARGLIKKAIVVPEPDYTYIDAVDPNLTGLMVDSVCAALRAANPPRYNEPRLKTPKRFMTPRKETPKPRTPRVPATPKVKRVRDFVSDEDILEDVSDDDDTPTQRKRTPRPEVPQKPAKLKKERGRHLKRKVVSSKDSGDNNTSSPVPKLKRRRKK